MLWLVLLNIRLAFIALANRFACYPVLANVNCIVIMMQTWFEISSCSSRGKFTKWSYLVPTRNGIAVLLKPLPWRYHSLMEFSVLFRVKSNMNKIATASLQTSGSIFTNSRWPPRSQMENVISVFRIEMVFSMKFTPRDTLISILYSKFLIYKTYLKSGYNPHPSSLRHTWPLN